eukprot:tig00020723_g13426.t1
MPSDGPPVFPSSQNHEELRDENPVGFKNRHDPGYHKDYVRVDNNQMHFERRKQILEKHPEIAKLQGYDRQSAFWIVFIIVAQTALAYFLKDQTNYWILFGVAYVLGAPLVHGMWVLVHDLTHNCVFASKFQNMFWHLIANLPILVPSTISFRHYHLMHHSYLNETYMDPDVPSPLEAKIFGTTALGKATWMLGFALWQGIRMVRFRGAGSWDRWIALNWLFQATYIYAIYQTCGLGALFYMSISSIFAIGLHPLGARWVAEHYATAPDQETYSYYGPSNIIGFNIGYHNEHHDLPRVPWSKLPEVRRMAPEFYDKLAWHDSYIKIMLRFIFDSNFTLKSRVVRWPKEKAK